MTLVSVPMAMLIAWQTLNAVRAANSKRFSKGFLIVTPGITIRDRLRVLLPNDAENQYQRINLVPHDLMPDRIKAKIGITNYHAFKLRETFEAAKGTRQVLEGHGEALQTLETEGQMIQRVMGDLMGLKGVVVINDEAHHCYRERPVSEEKRLTGDERKEALRLAGERYRETRYLERRRSMLPIDNEFDLSESMCPDVTR